MGYDELTRHLIRTAETRRDGILARARDEAVKITEEARKKSETVEPDVRDSTAGEAERARLLRMNRARQEANEAWLRARAGVVDAILARVEELLPLLLGEARYPAVAERLYREILPEFPAGNVILRADGVARVALERSISDARIRFEPLPETEIGGVEASDEDGTFLVRNTLRSRFVKARPALMVELWKRLPGPDE
ncbi:V-type ATP synthase subunit E [Candidatus Deferrimicrobium sp.]|uniref:V-type ATP synthase subunit E n=1 Tax=Candidatus Deferrimicrobium sp. TaxID=3060586 RepID=UPI002ED1BB73